MKLFILKGRRGAGKTRFCEMLFQAAAAGNMTTAGILTLTRREQSLRALDLYTQESRLLAHFNSSPVSQEIPREDKTVRTKQWTFDAATLLWGNRQIRRAPASDLFILDEAGILEFERNQGWTAGMARIDSQTDHRSVVVVRHELVSIARKRWGRSTILNIEDLNNPGEEELISRILGL